MNILVLLGIVSITLIALPFVALYASLAVIGGNDSRAEKFAVWADAHVRSFWILFIIGAWLLASGIVLAVITLSLALGALA